MPTGKECVMVPFIVICEDQTNMYTNSRPPQMHDSITRKARGRNILPWASEMEEEAWSGFIRVV